MKKTLISLCILSCLSIQANAFDVFHPIKSMGKAVIIGGIGYVAIQGTIDYLIKNPGKTSEWFAVHPEQLEPVTNYVNKKIENAQTEEEFNKFNNLKKQLALDVNTNISETVALEADGDWQIIKQEVEQAINQTDVILIQNNKLNPSCNASVIELLMLPNKEFESTVNNILPKNQNIPTQNLDVNTYIKLKENYNKKNIILLNHDHIPSYAAINEFFIINGIQVPKIRANSNLEKNSSAITVPEEIHKQGRTYAGRNTSKQISTDANNLLLATIKDITTIAYLFFKNPQYNISADDYIQNAMLIYARNKMLCMYDIK